MSNYKRKEVFDYLTRKPTTAQDIELAKTRIQIPVTPAPMQDASGEERVGYSEGSKLTGTGKTLEQNIKDDHKAFNDYRKSIGSPIIPLDNAYIRMWIRTRLSEGGRVELADGTLPNYNALSNEDRAAVAKQRVIDFANKFEKENNRLPSQQEIRKQGKFDFATVKKAIESGDVETLPLNQTKGEFTKIPVDNDLRKLDQSKVIKDAFKSGKAPDLKDVQKILNTKDPTKAANRITQLASTYIGDMEVEGINPKFQKTAKEIIDTNAYDYQIRDLYDKSVAKSVGEKRSPSSVRTTTQRDIIPTVKGYSIDEPAGVTSSVRNKTTPYGVFSQIIDTDINKGDKFAFDSIKSKKERVLQNAIASGDKKVINESLKDFNKTVSYYENKFNKDIGSGEKKIKLFKASLDTPENTIKNFDALPKQYQEAFKNNFTDRGYSYQVPKDIKTVYEIGEDLKNPKIASDVAKRAAKGQARIYSEFLPGTQAITSSVGDYLKGLAVDVKAGKLVTPFIKVLGTAAVPLTVYDAYEGYTEGLPLDETLLKGLLGAEGISQTFKEQAALSPKAREAKQVLSSNTDLGMDSMGGMGYIQGPSTMTEKEAEKIYLPEAEAYAKKVEQENLARAQERNKYIDYAKERFSPFSNETPIEMASGGRAKFASGSDDPESDLYIPPLNEKELSGTNVLKEGIDGLYFRTREEQRPIPVDPITGKSISSGGMRELKQVFSSLLSDTRPEAGYRKGNIDFYASKGINPFQGDTDFKYGASYTPEGNVGKFMIDKTPQYLGAGYTYEKDGLDLGITGLKDQMGDKSITLRFGYKYAKGGKVKK
jgi:hypothetical protein